MTAWLFAWEFGQGLGHLRRLGAIASTLVRPGERAILASEEPELGRPYFPVGLETVSVSAPPPPPFSAVAEGFLPSYAAQLLELGFADADYTTGRLALWDEILGRSRPTAVVADHAPFAILAASGQRPVAVIGTGLDLPPADGEVFPTVLPDWPPFDEALLLESLGEACRANGRNPPRCALEALARTLRFLVGLPAFDPYAARRNERCLGPLGERPPLTPCPAAGALFAYLNAGHPSFEALTWALAEAGLPATVYWGGQRDPGRARLLEARGCTVLDAPARLGDALPRHSLVLSLGGAGLVADALFAGRPHLVFPIHLESELHALGLEGLGAGRRLGAYGLAQAIEAAADTLALRDGALRAGLALLESFGEDPAPAIAAEIRSLA